MDERLWGASLLSATDDHRGSWPESRGGRLEMRDLDAQGIA